MSFNQTVMDVFDASEHYINDDIYMSLILADSTEGMNKSVTCGQLFEVDDIVSESDDLIVVTGSGSPSIGIRLNKEREFLRNNCMTRDELLTSLREGSKFYVKITSTEEGLIGSFNEAKMESMYKEFFEQVKNPTKTYDAKVLRKNRGGYFVTINGADAFLPGSLASANKIINFDALIGKTVKVMVDSYISENNTFIVSNKKYIEKIMPQLIDDMDIGTKHFGTVTGTMQTGIFVEFNDVMTGLLSVGDMDDETRAAFSTRNVRAGDVIPVFVRDIIPPKNFVLTQSLDKIEVTKSVLSKLNQSVLNSDAPVLVGASVCVIKGPYVTVGFDGIETTVFCGQHKISDLRLGSREKVALHVAKVDVNRNKLQASITREDE